MEDIADVMERIFGPLRKRPKELDIVINGIKIDQKTARAPDFELFSRYMKYVSDGFRGKHLLHYCNQCQHWTVICGTCGNNCCSGTYGEVNGKTCDDCRSAYDVSFSLTEYGCESLDKKEFSDLLKNIELPDPDKLEKLADVFDKVDSLTENDNDKIQRDLRKWAENIRLLINLKQKKK